MQFTLDMTKLFIFNESTNLLKKRLQKGDKKSSFFPQYQEE